MVVCFNWDVALPDSLQQHTPTHPAASRMAQRLAPPDAPDGSIEVDWGDANESTGNHPNQTNAKATLLGLTLAVNVVTV